MFAKMVCSRSLCAVVIAATLLIGASLPAAAVEVGIVNANRVAGGSTHCAATVGRVKQLLKDASDKASKDIEILLEDKLLTDDELATYQKILRKKAPTPDDAAIMTRLDSRSAAKQADYDRLAQKSDSQLTADDKKKIDELKPLVLSRYNRRQQRNVIIQQYQDLEDDQNQWLISYVLALVREAATKVAANKPLDLILSTDASVIYFFSPNLDVTSDIITAIDNSYPNEGAAPLSKIPGAPQTSVETPAAPALPG